MVGGRGRRAALAGMVLTLVLSGCAQFPETPTQGFQDNPPLGAGPEPTPQLPDVARPPSPPPGVSATPTTTPPAPGPCDDPDPAVVATCLDETSGITVLPDGSSAIVAERRTGRLLRVAPDTEPKLLDTVGVDASGDGGLLDVALSPTWDEDQLLYLYVSTSTDNRVLRLAVGDSPKPVLVGIPHGPGGNAGAIAFDKTGDLLVATGPVGDVVAAQDPTSLAGKLLRVDLAGRPAPGNPDPGSPVLSAGLGVPGGVCTDPVSGTSWVTDRAAGADRLRAVLPGRGLGPAVWAWPDQPGAAGCAAIGGRVAVSLTSGQALFVLTTSPEGAVLGDPEVLARGTYGRLNGAGVARDGLVWVGTVNKAGGQPKPVDDRVVRIQPSSGAGGSKPD